MSRLELLDSTRKGREGEDLENKLCHLVVGQDEAIHRVVRAYQTYLAGISPAGRPIGNFLFLGPTGTGKLASWRRLPRGACIGVSHNDGSPSLMFSRETQLLQERGAVGGRAA